MSNWFELKGGALVRIQSAYNSLLPVEQQVADFVLQNEKNISNISIQELALEAGTSKSSVTRFCKKIGYEGFKEFRGAIIRDLAAGVQNVHESIEDEDDAEAIIKKICQDNARASIETIQILDPSEIERAACLIMEAKRVLIFGDGPVAVVAIDLYHKLLRVGISCFYIQDRRLQSIQASMTSATDVVIGLSFSGASRGTINALQEVKENGAKTIAITNNIGSPITHIADINLYGTTSIKSITTGTIAPRTAQLCVVDSLFLVIINQNRDKVMEKLEKSKQVIVDDWVK